MLFLIFTALSYGDIDLKYTLRENAHQEFLSPPNGDRFDDVYLVVIPNGNSFSLIICIKNNFPMENSSSHKAVEREAKSESNNGKKDERLSY
jgi:hypothetical protein